MTTTAPYRPKAPHATGSIRALVALGVPHTHDDRCWCRTRRAPKRAMHWQPGDPIARFGWAGAA